MTNQQLEIGLVLLIVTIGLLVLSVIAGMIQATFVLIQKYEDRKVEELEAMEEELNHALDLVSIEQLYPEPKPVSHRHNVHCPSCGRFAKKFEGSDTIVICKVHEMQVRWKDMPIDWLVKPVAEGVTLVLDFTPQMPDITEAIDIVSVHTAPIDIIIPDDLSEIYELGARI